MTRNGNGWAANHLTHPEIAAVMALRRLDLAEWEQDAVLAMDTVRCELLAGAAEKPKVASRKLTPALFEALF